MSEKNHEAFRAGVNDLRGNPCYHCTAYDQIEAIKKLTDLAQLRAIAADQDLAVTVRQAAERRASGRWARPARSFRVSMDQPSAMILLSRTMTAPNGPPSPFSLPRLASSMARARK